MLRAQPSVTLPQMCRSRRRTSLQARIARWDTRAGGAPAVPSRWGAGSGGGVGARRAEPPQGLSRRLANFAGVRGASLVRPLLRARPRRACHHPGVIGGNPRTRAGENTEPLIVCRVPPPRRAPPPARTGVKPRCCCRGKPVNTGCRQWVNTRPVGAARGVRAAFGDCPASTRRPGGVPRSSGKLLLGWCGLRPGTQRPQMRPPRAPADPVHEGGLHIIARGFNPWSGAGGPVQEATWYPPGPVLTE